MSRHAVLVALRIGAVLAFVGGMLAALVPGQPDPGPILWGLAVAVTIIGACALVANGGRRRSDLEARRWHERRARELRS